jgi:hypothetical protein
VSKGKSTPEETFEMIFTAWIHPGTEEGVRKAAKRKMDDWLKRHGKTEDRPD